VSRACHMSVRTDVDSGGAAWTIDTGQSVSGGSMRTYVVVSQHTCKRAVNGSIPLGGSLGSDSVPGIGVFAFRLGTTPRFRIPDADGSQVSETGELIERTARIYALRRNPHPS
jgi:hypothetical protein